MRHETVDQPETSQLLAEHFGVVRKMVAKYVPASEVEDAAQNLIVRILEHRGLDRYDPSRAKVSTYLGSYTAASARGELDKVTKRWSRQVPVEDVSLQATAEVGYERVEAAVDIDRAFRRVMERTASVELRSGVTMAEVVEYMYERSREDFSFPETVMIQQRFGVSRQSARRWRSRVFEELRSELSLSA